MQADKYCLTRIWAWSPFIGNELARFSRRYFFSGAILAYAIISAYAWAQFPYDNICEPTQDATLGASGEYTTKEGTITVEQDTFVVYCGQSWRDFSGLVFPPTSRVQPSDKQWMRGSQDTLADLYGLTALILFCAFIFILFGGTLTNYVLSMFRGVYKPSGQDQHIDFSANKEIFAYVPQIKWPGFAFPFLACDVDHIDQELIGWNDPSHSYDYYNLIFDVPWEGMPRKKIITENTRTTTQISAQEEFHANSQRFIKKQVKNGQETGLEVKASVRPIFSLIKHYPPEWAQKLQDDVDES